MQLCACRVRACERSLSQMSLRVFLAFVCLYDICQFRRADMPHRVYSYSLSGGGSIDWVPGVPLAAWGSPGRTQGAVRAAPKTRNYDTTTVNQIWHVVPPHRGRRHELGWEWIEICPARLANSLSLGRASRGCRERVGPCFEGELLY